MDPSAIAGALLAANAGQTQMALAAKMVRMNASADAAIVQVIEAAQNNLDRLANVAAGVGQSLDVSA